MSVSRLLFAFSFFLRQIVHLHSVHATIFLHILTYHKTVEVNAKKNIEFDTFLMLFVVVVVEALKLISFCMLVQCTPLLALACITSLIFMLVLVDYFVGFFG